MLPQTRVQVIEHISKEVVIWVVHLTYPNL